MKKAWAIKGPNGIIIETVASAKTNVKLKNEFEEVRVLVIDEEAIEELGNVCSGPFPGLLSALRQWIPCTRMRMDGKDSIAR